MIARHAGQVLLISGAIPGEVVSVRVERVEKRLAFASTATVLEPSADRRDAHDPLCGGCLYAHISYPRQVLLKADIIADAFTRIGQIALPDRIDVRPSPETGYRVRARLHVQRDGVGFYREGTHSLCDARTTGQLSSAAMDAVDATLSALDDARSAITSLELAENLAADQRAVHFDLRPPASSIEVSLARAVAAGQLTGCTARGQIGPPVRLGEPVVVDPLSVLTRGLAATGGLARHPAAFFQGNRFLLPDLVGAVLESTPPTHAVMDLYAGVGLFTVAFAATGRNRITAIEGDKTSGRDLRNNAAPYPAIETVIGSVEDYVRRSRPRANTIVVDPPRTGMSRDAADSIIAHRAERIVYVSCDPPTMARDARRLLDGGYRLLSLRGFDLFPNTPHVETMGVFELC
jgi:23S rRNA (uracil1939-C5)-methyltransferase